MKTINIELFFLKSSKETNEIIESVYESEWYTCRTIRYKNQHKMPKTTITPKTNDMPELTVINGNRIHIGPYENKIALSKAIDHIVEIMQINPSIEYYSVHREKPLPA